MNVNKAKGRMFRFVTHTYHPVIGCLHGCCYCWAEALIESRLKHHGGKYKDGFFVPKLVESELIGEWKIKNAIVGVSLTGDMWGEWIPREWILAVIEKIKEADKSNRFLFQTKNPARYKEFVHEFPDNIILGTTIETNYGFDVSKAPHPQRRYEAIRYLSFPKFLSVEPIMAFQLETLIRWIDDIKPIAIEIGADNYGHHLTEPLKEDVEKLLAHLRQKGYTVYEKQGLSRLLGSV